MKMRPLVLIGLILDYTEHHAPILTVGRAVEPREVRSLAILPFT